MDSGEPLKEVKFTFQPLGATTLGAANGNAQHQSPRFTKVKAGEERRFQDGHSHSTGRRGLCHSGGIRVGVRHLVRKTG